MFFFFAGVFFADIVLLPNWEWECPILPHCFRVFQHPRDSIDVHLPRRIPRHHRWCSGVAVVCELVHRSAWLFRWRVQLRVPARGNIPESVVERVHEQ